MIILEFKAKGKKYQYSGINEAIRTVQFIRNSCLRYWIDNKGVNKFDLSKYSAVLAKNFPFANQLNSTARQAASERAWSSIVRFFDNCKKKVPGRSLKSVYQLELIPVSVDARYIAILRVMSDIAYPSKAKGNRQKAIVKRV